MEFAQEQEAVSTDIPTYSRKLATIRIVDEIRPIAKADQIELAILGGWQVVVKKGEFQAGFPCLYIEIDSFVPHDVAPFLTKPGHDPREFEGVRGERLKTIRLRGEVSQGLVLPLSVLPEFWNEDWCVGQDVSEILNIKKYEKPLAANMRGNARRYFPNFIQKTDQERVQNRLRTLEAREEDEEYELTLKLDGSSTTFYHYNGDTGVCSRNLELKTDESNKGNVFVDKYHELGISDKLKALGRNIAIQGELWGTGINGNWEKVDGVYFSVFDIFDCDKYCYLGAYERYKIVHDLGLAHTPILGLGTLASMGMGSLRIEDFLAVADRASLFNKVAEGVVLKSLKEPNFSFKVVNNRYLLNGGE